MTIDHDDQVALLLFVVLYTDLPQETLAAAGIEAVAGSGLRA